MAIPNLWDTVHSVGAHASTHVVSSLVRHIGMYDPMVSSVLCGGV